jgi:hypothetical protein
MTIQLCFKVDLPDGVFINFLIRGCKALASNQTVTPIISRRVLDRVYLDLMDFTSQPDGEYNYVA